MEGRGRGGGLGIKYEAVMFLFLFDAKKFGKEKSVSLSRLLNQIVSCSSNHHFPLQIVSMLTGELSTTST